MPYDFATRLSAIEKRLAALEQSTETHVVMNVTVPDARSFAAAVDRTRTQALSAVSQSLVGPSYCVHCYRGYGQLHKTGCKRVTQTFGVAPRDAKGNPWRWHYPSNRTNNRP